MRKFKLLKPLPGFQPGHVFAEMYNGTFVPTGGGCVPFSIPPLLVEGCKDWFEEIDAIQWTNKNMIAFNQWCKQNEGKYAEGELIPNFIIDNKL